MSNAEESDDTKTPVPSSKIDDSTAAENRDADITSNDCQTDESKAGILPSKTEDNSGTTDQNSSPKVDSTDAVIVKSSDGEAHEASHENDATHSNANDGQNVADEDTSEPVKNDDNTAVETENDGENANINKDEKAEGKDEEDEEGEASEPEVVTYSGYTPISNILWDWEPPKKPPQHPPPTATVRESHASTDEELMYTDVGEKARPTPYIYEIKKRKFEKKAKNKLFVGGLVFEATKEFLYDQFEKYGELDDACVVTERGTGQSRGFGYVTFVNQDDAEEAIKAIDGLRINGKTLCVEFADDPKASPRGRRRSQSPPPGRFQGRPPSRGRGRGFPRARGRHYDVDRHPDRDPYYDRYTREPDPYYRRGGNDPYYSPRDYNRPPPPRDYDRPPPPRDYDRPSPPRDYDRFPSRDYDHLPPQRRYDRDPPSRGYDDYRRPPPTYPERYPPPRQEATMKDVDFARLRVDREKVRQETSVADQRRLLARRGNKPGKKTTAPSSSSSDSSDEEKKPKEPKRRKVLPKAYMYF